MFLALRAMEQDRDDEAIQHLKRALALEPESGLLHHLLGALYAQLGMIDRALEELTRATECNPSLHVARFQLGLLYFTSANAAAAEAAWEPLTGLPDDHPLRVFKTGLMHMARDEFPAAVAQLRRGLELNEEYPSLTEDMRMVMELCEQAAAGTPSPAAAPATASQHPASQHPASQQPAAPPAETGARHVLLSGYQGMADKK